MESTKLVEDCDVKIKEAQLLKKLSRIGYLMKSEAQCVEPHKPQSRVSEEGWQ